MRNIELFDAYAIHIFATLHDAFLLSRRIDPAAVVKEVGIKAAKARCAWPTSRHGQLASVFLDDPSDRRSESTYRYVIYARFSTDLQSAASIDDQVRACRERIERDGTRWFMSTRTAPSRVQTGCPASFP